MIDFWLHTFAFILCTCSQVWLARASLNRSERLNAEAQRLAFAFDIPLHFDLDTSDWCEGSHTTMYYDFDWKEAPLSSRSLPVVTGQTTWIGPCQPDQQFWVLFFKLLICNERRDEQVSFICWRCSFFLDLFETLTASHVMNYDCLVKRLHFVKICFQTEGAKAWLQIK